jgi:hypothetical protein
MKYAAAAGLALKRELKKQEQTVHIPQLRQRAMEQQECGACRASVYAFAKRNQYEHAQGHP